MMILEALIIINTALLLLVLYKLSVSGSSLPGRETKNNPRYLLDTSAIIDGRISEVIQAGFMPGELLVPEFILAELHHIADSSEDLRRQRGRFGLELVKKLQTQKGTILKVITDDPKSVQKVDDKLIKLAKQLEASVVTTDFNLNRIASIHEVEVLNVNQLAQNLRPLILPGESITLKLIQKGSDKGQAVGYLDDGTMIVVENARKLIGKSVEVEITRIMQTVAGKMMFAHLKS